MRYQSTGGFMTPWAMEMSGRLSEEHSKKEYSEALKLILNGGSAEAFNNLADSLLCVKKVLCELLGCFWSFEYIDCDNMNLKRNENINNGDSNNKNNNNNNNNSSNNNINDNNNNNDNDNNDKNDQRHTFDDMRKVLIPQTISCDFIDAAALSASFLQKIDIEMFQKIILRNTNNFCSENDNDKNDNYHSNMDGDNDNNRSSYSYKCFNFGNADKNDGDNNESNDNNHNKNDDNSTNYKCKKGDDNDENKKYNHRADNINKNDNDNINKNDNDGKNVNKTSNDKINKIDAYNDCLRVPVFLFSLRAVTRYARDMISNASINAGINNGINARSLSCRSTQSSSTIKITNLQQCKINMTWYFRLSNNNDNENVNYNNDIDSNNDNDSKNNVNNHNNSSNYNNNINYSNYSSYYSNNNNYNDNMHSRNNSFNSVSTTRGYSRNSFLSHSDDLSYNEKNVNFHLNTDLSDEIISALNYINSDINVNIDENINLTPSKRFSMIIQSSSRSPSPIPSFNSHRRYSLNLPQSCIPKKLLITPQIYNTSSSSILLSKTSPNFVSNNLYYILLPSITDPMTDLSGGLLNVESSAISSNRWLCESLAPVLPCLGK